MRNLKKFLALVLAMMMTLSLMVTVNAKNVEFDDGESVNDAFIDDLTVLAGMGVIQGMDDGSFAPQSTVTRAQMAAIVYRLRTGDASADPEYKDKSNMYAGYGDFKDVKDTSWYAGYVGYCANAGIIIGDGDGNFRPNSPVTGYEALVMLLRAMGYNQPNEFTGKDWRQHAASIATQRGMLAKVDTTSYRGTLMNGAAREVVAEITFQAATKAQVVYTAAFGYQTTGMSGGVLSDKLNPTLGWQYYGLTSDTGIVLGNQATGESNTLVGFNSVTGDEDVNGLPEGKEFIEDGDGNYTYASVADTNITVPFDVKTGLDMFGHKAEVWYDGRANNYGYTINATTHNVEQGANKTYAVMDKAVLAEYVYAEDGDLSVAGDGTGATNALLGAAAIDAGFSAKRGIGASGASGANTTANLSAIYTRIDSTKAKDAATATGFANASPVNMYYLVSNNSGKTVDVAVSLSAEVGVIAEKNTTAKTQYLILGSSVGNASAFGNGATATANQIHLKKLTPDSVQKLGEMVTAWQVMGTTKAVANLTAADYLYQLDAMKTVTKQVSSYVAPTPAVTLDTNATPVITKVNFTDGTSMELSGITMGDKTNSKIISKALPIVISAADGPVGTAGTVAAINDASAGLVTNLHAGTPYTVYVDVLGRFISMTTTPEIEFIYGTFADFEIGGLGTGTSKYAITGVGKDGQTMINRDLTAMGGTPIEGNVGTTYNTLPLTQKDYGNANSTVGNQIKEGQNTGYMIDKDGDLTAYTGKKMVNGNSWTISANDVTIGVARVQSNSVDYLLNENTQFYVVEGSGSATLKVTPYKGIKALLDGSNSAEISFATGDDEVVFWTAEDLYGTVSTNRNHNVATVILSDTNLTRWAANSMFYSFNQTDATGLVLPGAAASVAQYELYANGEKGTYFIDTSVSVKADGTAWDDDLTDTDYKTESIEQDTFYTLTKIKEVNGVPVYKAVGIEANTNLAYADGLNTGVTYNYIAVNNLNFANLTKGTGDLIFNVGNAKICDVEYKDGTKADPDTSVTDDRNEITTIAELNNMISVMKTDGTTAVYSCEVSVVYDANNVATIYITKIATT